VIKQVPDSRLRKYPVPLSEDILPYVKEKCQYGYDRMDSLLVIQSPAINITATEPVSKLTNYLTLQLFTVVPKGANINTDFCLGKIDDVALVWKCYSRNLIDVADGRFLYFTNELGAYAVLFSPLNVTKVGYSSGVYTVWFVENPRIAALYIVIIFFLLLFIGLSLWCVSIQMREYRRTAKELKEYQKVLKQNFKGGLRREEVNPNTFDESNESSNPDLDSKNKRMEEMSKEIERLKRELEHYRTTAREDEKSN